MMRRTTMTIGFWLGLASAVCAAEDIKDYVGPFPTEALHAMCSQASQRDKCLMYIQGLMYGLKTQRAMQEHGTPVCVPEMSAEEARVRILKLIDTATAGDPTKNKDGGDWMAFMGLAAGNLCEQRVGFRTPSNNIHCQLSESDSYLRCDMKELSNALPPKPRDCDLDWGSTFGLAGDGEPGRRLCAGDTVADDALPVLGYGSSWDRAGYKCKSEQSGLTCVNASGHGFRLSKSRQELF